MDDVSISAASTDATLSALTISVGTLNPTFASATTSYTASVANATTSVTVTPTRNQANATIQAQVNSGGYSSVTSGSPSGSLSLNVGDNPIDVKVTAQDGTTTKTYTITVTRAATSPTLSSPTVSSIATTSATLGATVSSNGGATLTARGTVWGTSASPTGNALADGSTTVSAFTHSRTGLTANTLYYYRGYATNSVGTSYSADGSFTTLPMAPTVGSGSSATSSGFTANWSHPTMGSESYTYTVEVDDDNAFGSINATVSSIASSNTSQAITGLSASTTYYFRVKAVNTQGSSDWSSTSAGIATSSASTPTISPSGTLIAVSTTYGTASTSPTSFSVSGSALTNDILITPPSGFEISITAGGADGYSSTQTLTQSGGTVASTTVYIRLAATTAAATYSGDIVLSSSGATSQNVATVSSTVSAKALTITGLTGTNKEYDRTTSASFTGTAAYSGLVNSESFTVSGTPSASFATAIVGTAKTITVSGYTAPSANYTLTQPTVTADITAKALTISGAAATNKTYDGNANATITGTLSGVIIGDAVTLSGTGTFASANAGTAIAVTSTSTLTGADAGNYSLTQPTGLTANIDKANQTITFNALPTKTTADPDFPPGATSATSGTNTITYSSSNTSVATIVSGNIRIVGAGTSTITASQAGSPNYNAAADVNQTLTVTPPVVTIAAWNFWGISSPATATATTFNANLVSTSPASDITRGAGASASSASNSFRTTGFQNNGISTSNTDYFQVTLGAKAGYKLSLRTIDARFTGTSSFYGSPGVTSQFAYSLDGTNFTLIGSAVQTTSLTMTQIDLSGVSALQNVTGGTTVTIRYYASGQTTTGGWGFNSPTSSDNGLAFGGFLEALPAGPTLTAASSATVDNDLDITFSDDAAWRAAVTAVKYGSNTLSSSTDYTLSAGTLTLKPSGSAGSGLRTAGTQTVTVVATNYTDATVSQTIGAGAATKLLISTQPTAPLNNGEVLAAQPVLRVADQYDNTTSSTATVAASVASGTWTLGGTSSLAAVSGTATFTGLTATSAAAVTGATISFASTGLTGVTSSAFNIPAPPRAEPSEHPTSFAASLGIPSFSVISLSWTDAGGSVTPDGYLIKGSTVSFASITDPVDGTAESDAGLNKNIAQGVQAASFTGLTSNTTYYFKIYSYTNAGSLINYKLDGVILQSSATTDRSTSSTDYFRSKATGDWATAGTWESSNDGTNNWITATAAPTSAATAITVQNGHTLTISSAVTIDKTTIANGGIVKLVNDGAVSQSGAITLANGATDQLTIQSGGTLQVVVSSSSATYNYTTLVNYQTSGNINVNSGGKIIVGDGSTTHIGSGYGGFGWESSTKITWSDGSIFEWNSTAATIPSTSGQTFFPGVSASVVPILRFTAIGGTPGGGSATIVNGRFEANTNLSWSGAGTKTFRNGISGTGNITQANGCGQFILSGTAQIGGSGILTLEANDLSVTGTATFTSNKQIDMAAGTSASIVTVSGTLDLAGYVLSGSTAVSLTSTGTLKTSHASGIAESLTNSGTNSFTSGTVDHSSASSQTISVANYGSITNTGGGARTLGAGTIKIAGTFTTGAGNYTIGTGTVEFNGSTAQTIPVIPVSGGPNYYNLIHSGSSSATLEGSMTVGNNLTISGTNANSILFITNAGARTLTIDGNLILTDGELDFAASGSTAAGTINLKGNLSQTAGITFTAAEVKNGTINFSGSGTVASPQTISLTQTNAIQYTNLSVASGTVVQLNNNLILTGSATANYIGTLTVSGALNSGVYSVSADAISGSFILNAGATLLTANTTGLSGAIPTSSMSRSFDNDANYEFTGSSAIGNTNFSNTTMNNLVISNTAGVTLGSNISVRGNISINSGASFSASSRTITLKGTWNNAGSFTSGTSTIILDGSSAQSISHSGTGGYNNFSFNNASGITLNNSITVTGALTFTNGVLDIGTNTVTYPGNSISRGSGSIDSDAGSLSFTNASALSLPSSLFSGEVKNFILNGSGGVTLGSNTTISGDLTLTTGTLDLSTSVLTYAGSSLTRTNGKMDADGGGGAGGIIFANTSPVSLPASIFLGNINNLTMNGAGGVTIGDNQTIAGTLTLTSGVFTLGNNSISLTGTLSGGSSGSYIKTNGTGKLTRNNITSSTVFPIGNAKYNPITVNNSDGLNWSVSAADGVTPNTGFSADAAVLMTWDITPSTTPTPSPTSITFQFDGTYPGGQVGSLYSSATRLQAFRRNRYDEYWFGSGGTLEFPDATNITATTVTINGLTGFSKYALSNVGSPLPVSLLSFSGYKDGTRNQLRWVTASESNNRGFEVERSADGRTYQSIGFVNSLAIGGNSQSQLRYSFTDLTPGGTKQYYRLKQSDIDGRSTLSNILVIQGEKPTALEIASVFPNPSSGLVTVLIDAPANDNVNIRLLDMAGRILETRSVSVLTGSNSISFDLSKRSKGQYLISVGEKTIRVIRE